MVGERAAPTAQPAQRTALYTRSAPSTTSKVSTPRPAGGSPHQSKSHTDTRQALSPGTCASTFCLVMGVMAGRSVNTTSLAPALACELHGHRHIRRKVNSRRYRHSTSEYSVRTATTPHTPTPLPSSKHRNPRTLHPRRSPLQTSAANTTAESHTDVPVWPRRVGLRITCLNA